MEGTKFPIESIIIFGTLAVGVLIIGIIIFSRQIISQKLTYQKRLLQATIQAEESLRKRIAGNLHDEVGGLLITNQLILNRLLKNSELLQSQTEDLEESNNLLNETIHSVRGLSFELMPSTLEKFGLKEGIKELCTKRSKTGIPVRFSWDNEIKEPNIQNSLVIYRVIQELLNNALKHAKPSFVEVKFSYIKENGIHISVVDDGLGFNFKKVISNPQKGIGLTNIFSRLQQINGEISYSNNLPNGTFISILIPH